MTARRDATEDHAIPLDILLEDVERAADAAGWAEFSDWAHCEQSGYRDREVPEYRRISGVPMGFVPGTGWVPLFIRDAEERRRISVHGLAQPVKQIDAAIAQSVNGKAFIHYPTEKVQGLNGRLDKSYHSMATCVDHRQLQDLLVTIRQRAMRKLVALGVSPTAVRSAPRVSAGRDAARTSREGANGRRSQTGGLQKAAQATHDVLEELQLLGEPLTRFGFDRDRVAGDAERVRMALKTARDRDDLAGPLAQLKLTFAGHPSIIATGLDVRLARCLDLLR